MPKNYLQDKFKESEISDEDVKKGVEPDWEHFCEVCGETPIVPLTGMCGPCTFGEADTVGGNW